MGTARILPPDVSAITSCSLKLAACQVMRQFLSMGQHVFDLYLLSRPDLLSYDAGSHSFSEGGDAATALMADVEAEALWEYFRRSWKVCVEQKDTVSKGYRKKPMRVGSGNAQVTYW